MSHIRKNIAQLLLVIRTAACLLLTFDKDDSYGFFLREQPKVELIVGQVPPRFNRLNIWVLQLG